MTSPGSIISPMTEKVIALRKKKGGWRAAGPERALRLGLAVLVKPSKMKVISVPACAARWGVTPQRVSQWIAEGRIAAIWIEGCGLKMGLRFRSGWAIPPGIRRPSPRMTRTMTRSLKRATKLAS